MGAKIIPGSYQDILRKSREVNPAGARRFRRHVRLEKWLVEMEEEHANDTEPDFATGQEVAQT